MKKRIILLLSLFIILILFISVGIILVYFLGIPKCAGEKKYSYTIKEKHIVFDEYNLYGKTLIPNGEEKVYPAVIYVHGAESSHSADMATLKSLAESGIAVYTFDIYGWSKKSSGNKGDGDYFKGTPRNVDDAYEKQVIQQAYYLDNVIEQVKDFEYVDKNNLYVIGSSMGGATTCACVIRHTQDIKGVILQYPAINLVPDLMKESAVYDISQYKNKILILQGTDDKIVPYKWSENLNDYCNVHGTPSEIVMYEGQPHVFTGKYKIKAAEEIYRFINSNK